MEFQKYDVKEKKKEKKERKNEQTKTNKVAKIVKVVWYAHLFRNFPQFVVIHTVKGFGIVNKAELDVFLELSCFFNEPVDVGNLISGSSAFSKTSLNIWKFMVHVLLKPDLENFEHYSKFFIYWNPNTNSTSSVIVNFQVILVEKYLRVSKWQE